MVKAIKNAKTLKGWKTILFNSGAAIPVILDAVGQVANIPEISGILPPQYAPFYALAVALVNIGLRYVTTTPVGKKL